MTDTLTGTLTRGRRFYAAIEAERAERVEDDLQAAFFHDLHAAAPTTSYSLARPERDDDEPICARCGHRSIRRLCADCDDTLNGVTL